VLRDGKATGQGAEQEARRASKPIHKDTFANEIERREYNANMHAKAYLAMALVWLVMMLVSPALKAAAPNIVLIVSDDQGWNAVGYHHGFVDTPNIDRIAHQGVELDRFYVSPMCSPTRAGLMTGRYPIRFGMARSVVRPWLRYGLPAEELTLPQALAQAGYRDRGIFGKWHLGHLDPAWHPLARGFTEFVGQYNGEADYLTRRRNGEIDWHHNYDDIEPEGHSTELIGKAACGFIAGHAKSGPFFCYVPFNAPHDPLRSPKEWLAKYPQLKGDEQDMAATVAMMDDQIGRILQTIHDSGVANDTLIVFFSDNGGVLRPPNNNAPLREGKLTTYEGGVRVPAAAWWPGHIEGGRKIETPIINLDLFPAFMHAAGIPGIKGSKPLDGVDVFNVLTGKESKTASRDLYFFHAQSGPQREHLAVIDADDWKLVVFGPDIRQEAKLDPARHRSELFHLSDDPYEKNDLARQYPERVKELFAKVLAFRNLEPANAMPTVNKPPEGFNPPPHWHNAPTQK